MLIGMMTVGCGKTARLERDRLEAAQEQARLAAEADRLTNRSYWKMFKDHVWTYKERFATGAVITLAIATSYYFFYKPKQQNLQGNTPPGAKAPPSSAENIQQIEDGNLLPQGVQEQAQIPVPQLNNIPHPNNNLQVNNPPPEHRLKYVYKLPFKASRNTHKKPFYNPKGNFLGWRNTRKVHIKHPNQQEPGLCGKISYVFPEKDADFEKVLDDIKQSTLKKTNAV